jgi:hypothetical protein
VERRLFRQGRLDIQRLAATAANVPAHFEEMLSGADIVTGFNAPAYGSFSRKTLPSKIPGFSVEPGRQGRLL